VLVHFTDQFLPKFARGHLVDAPDLAFTDSRAHLETFVLVWHFVKLLLVDFHFLDITLVVVLWVGILLGDADAHNCARACLVIIFIFLGRVLLIIALLIICIVAFVSISLLLWCSQVDAWDPLLKFLCTDVTTHRVESVQVPETFVDQIKHVRIQAQFFLVVFDQLKNGASQVTRHNFSEVCIVRLLHSAHLVEVKWQRQPIQEFLELWCHVHPQFLNLKFVQNVIVDKALNLSLVENQAGLRLIIKSCTLGV